MFFNYCIELINHGLAVYVGYWVHNCIYKDSQHIFNINNDPLSLVFTHKISPLRIFRSPHLKFILKNWETFVGSRKLCLQKQFFINKSSRINPNPILESLFSSILLKKIRNVIGTWYRQDHTLKKSNRILLTGKNRSLLNTRSLKFCFALTENY